MGSTLGSELIREIVSQSRSKLLFLASRVSRLAGPADSLQNWEVLSMSSVFEVDELLVIKEGFLIRTLRVWSYLLQWKVRGHRRNHSPFCDHETKCWRWCARDGCSGLVCDWCYLLGRWCPTLAPDVDEVTRVTPDGAPDPFWKSPPLARRLAEAFFNLELHSS